MGEAIEADRFDAAFLGYGPKGNSALSEMNVTRLWKSAAAITADVAEQTWLVVCCIKAGHDPDWLDAQSVGRTAVGSLAMFENRVMP